jgi:hypothetical protein
VPVPYRPLAIVSGLTIGDYLLWNWSLNANHDVLALVSGLTLPPLAIACLWLIALTAARLLARTTRGATGARRARARKPPAKHPKRAAGAGATPQPAPRTASAASAAPASARSSRKIAA